MKVDLPKTEAKVAKAFGINVSKAMFVARARSFSRPKDGATPCQEMSHVIIAKDPPTYDLLVAQGDDLGLPVPFEMILDSRSRVIKPQPPALLEALPEGVSSHFDSCCRRSRDVTILIVGEVEVGPNKLEPRFAVLPHQSVTVDVDLTKPAGVQPILAAQIFSGPLNTCRDEVAGK